MRSRALRLRVRGALAIALGALAGIALAPAPAQATAYGAQLPVTLEVRGDGGVKLSGLYGWLQFDDGNTKYRYEVYLCRESSYSSANAWVKANGVVRDSYSVNYGNVNIPQCRYPALLISKEDNVGGTVANVTFELEGVNFSGNVATRIRRSTTYDNPFN